MSLALPDGNAYMIDLGHLDDFRNDLVNLFTKEGYICFAFEWAANYLAIQTILYKLLPEDVKHRVTNWNKVPWEDYVAGYAPNVVDIHLVLKDLIDYTTMGNFFSSSNRADKAMSSSLRNIIRFLFGISMCKVCQGQGHDWDLRFDTFFRAINRLSDQPIFYSLFDAVGPLWAGFWFLCTHFFDDYITPDMK